MKWDAGGRNEQITENQDKKEKKANQKQQKTIKSQK